MDATRAAFEAWKADRSRPSLTLLLEASQDAIYGTCFEVLRHRHDAEDAAQRVLMEIQEGLDRVSDAEHFVRRVRLVAFRTAMSTLRGRRRRIERERKAVDMERSAPVPDDVRSAIHEAMAALDDESRGLLIEHYFERTSLEEMGASRGISGAAIWKRIEGVKGRLRDALALAGLAAAAGQAEACLQGVQAVTASANLVTGTVLAKTAIVGGTAMAAKASTATVAALVAVLTFGLGVGGGLAIQAARAPASAHPHSSTRSEEPLAAQSPRPDVAGARETAGVRTAATGAEERLKLAEEIWEQFSRPRFWKDEEAQAETLPKLKRLGADLAAYYVGRFRDATLERSKRMAAVRLAVLCGGSDAAALIIELIAQSPSEDRRCFLMSADGGLTGWPTERLPELPYTPELAHAARMLDDRVFALRLLSYGPREEWMPLAKQHVRTTPDSHQRRELLELLGRLGDAETLAYLRQHRDEIVAVTLLPDGTDLRLMQHYAREALAREVDRTIAELERRLGR